MDSPGSTDRRTTGTDRNSTSYGPAFWAGTGLAALLAGPVGVFLVLPLGLVVSEFVIFPLALGVGAILASLGAGWAGNRLAPDRTRTHLLRVVGVTAAVSALAAAIVLANAALRLALHGPVFYVGLFGVLVLALTATVATGRLRSAERGSRDGLLTLGLLALAVVSVPAVIFLAWLAGPTGA